MITPAVQQLAQEVWDRRAAGTLLDAETLGRELAAVVAADVAEHAKYDPEADQRVWWLRAVIRRIREPGRNDLDAIAGFLLDRGELAATCGRDRAAGS